jgi:UDP-N-acetylglucosamine--N-acetylmuramyl-(pentapeptide) pyrophosphoryl-undecaprenol N-acetylglucosamine transferase
MNIVIAAGGTGGHLYPAVALAREFLNRDPSTRVLFLGTARGIESKVLTHEGFELKLIAAKPVMGRGIREAALALIGFPIAVVQSIGILRSRRADLVIGVGGYTSPAVIVAAFLLRIARVIVEPNAYPGLANMAVGPFAQRVFLAFESAAGSFSASKVRVVGTPVRQAFHDAGGTGAGLAVDTGTKRLLVFGGSQGAKAINQAMIEALSKLRDMKDTLQVTHQTGDADHARVKAAYDATGFRGSVVPFVYDMPLVLRAADLVVARSGAMTIAEVTACGKPAILIPLPQAIYNHQAKNAQVMEAAGAAMVIPQSDLNGPTLAQAIRSILEDADRLQAMSQRSVTIRRIDSAEVIVRECYALMGGQNGTNGVIGRAGAQ